jgi:hypothetical protein
LNIGSWRERIADAESPSIYEDDVQSARELLGGQTSQVEVTGGEVIKAYLREVDREQSPGWVPLKG